MLAPQLAVVVISLRAAPVLVEAVRSVVEQEPAAEVVLVNSRGGDPVGLLRGHGLDVPVVDRPERLLPGAVRNLGVAATSAPYLAFLASDCIAEPGWVEGRLRAHAAGALAVGSLLTNPYPESRSACAAALLLHHRRLGHTPLHERLVLGLSYDRSLFERLGPFREDLRTGEDSDFNGRLGAAGVYPVVAQNVRTAHRNPSKPRDLIQEQFARGVRQSQAHAEFGMFSRRRKLPLLMLADARTAWSRSSSGTPPAERRQLRRAWPLIAPGALAYAAGALAANLADRR